MQFTRVSGNIAYGTFISTNNEADKSITAQLNTNGTLDLYASSQILASFCDTQAQGAGLCGA
jgi:hypothetical protein